MSRSTLYIPERNHYYVAGVWGFPGDLEVGSGIHAPVELSIMPGWKARLTSAWINVETEPTGASVICDIKSNFDIWSVPRAARGWATVFGADHPSIGAGLIQNDGPITTFAVNPMEFRNVFEPEATPKKVLFRGDILQVGSTTPGKSLTMTLEMLVIEDY